MGKGSEPVLALDGVSKRLGRRMALDGAAAEFHAGEIYIVTGGSHRARGVVARVLSGQSPIDSGRIVRRGRVAPLLGVSMGMNNVATVLRGLEVRASAYDLDRDRYFERIAELLDNPGVLRRHPRDLGPVDKALIQYASAYLLPCAAYVCDGAPLPGEDTAKERLTPLIAEARERGAIICFGRKPTMASELGDRRLARLTEGRLEVLKRLAPTPEQRRKRERKKARREARAARKQMEGAA